VAEAYILDVADDPQYGVVVVLDNGKRYAVEGGDASVAVLWYGSQRVRVGPDRGNKSTVRLTNLSVTSGSKSVQARRVAEVDGEADR
jgi:hypothetical protein